MGVRTHKDRPGADSHRPWLPGNGSTNNPAAPQTETTAQQLLAAATSRFQKEKNSGVSVRGNADAHTRLAQGRRRSARPKSGGRSTAAKSIRAAKHPPRGTGTPVKVFASLARPSKPSRSPPSSPVASRHNVRTRLPEKRAVMSRSPNHYHHCDRPNEPRQPITQAKEGSNTNKIRVGASLCAPVDDLPSGPDSRRRRENRRRR